MDNKGTVFSQRLDEYAASQQILSAGTTSILNYLKAPTTISIEDGMAAQDTTYQQGDSSQAQKYPIIVIINGAGGNGKDTFIEAVGKKCAALNLSSVTEVKEAANTLIELAKTHNASYWDTNPITNQEEKSDKYRTFLHDIKMAWINFCDGPAQCLYDSIRSTIITQLNGGEAYDVIFLHIREVDEISKVRTYLTQNMGLITLTVLVRGLVDASTYTNSGDADVENFSYDMTITNRGTLEMWEVQASMFAERLVQANSLYGIASRSTVYDKSWTVDETPTESDVSDIDNTNPDTTTDTTENVTDTSTTSLGFHPDNDTADTTGA